MRVAAAVPRRWRGRAAGFLAARALKGAGAQHVWIAGTHEGDGIDSQVFMGCDVLHALKLAHAELGL